MDIFEYIDRVKANFDKQPEPRYNTKKYFTDNVDDIGPGPNNRNKIPRLNVMPETYNSEEQGSGVMIDPRGLQDGKIPLPTQGLNEGGIATPKRGLVDEPGSYAGKEFTNQQLLDLGFSKGSNLQPQKETYKKLAEIFQQADIDDELEYLLEKSKNNPKGKIESTLRNVFQKLPEDEKGLKYIANLLGEDVEFVLDKIDDKKILAASGRDDARLASRYEKGNKLRKDFGKVENWMLKNASKYSDPDKFKKATVNRFGKKNAAIKAMTSGGGNFFSTEFNNDILGYKGTADFAKINKNIGDNIFRTTIYNFNPNVRKAVTNEFKSILSGGPAEVQAEARKKIKQSKLFKQFGLTKKIHGPISRLIYKEVGEELYKNLQSFRNPRVHTIDFIRYLEGEVDPKYKRQFKQARIAMEAAGKNEFKKAKQVLGMSDKIMYDHKIPSSFIKAGYADEIEYIKTTPTTENFNVKIKNKQYDVPVKKLLNKFEKASTPKAKQVIYNTILEKHNNFSKKYGGYLDNVKPSFTDGKIKFSSDASPVSKKTDFLKDFTKAGIQTGELDQKQVKKIIMSVTDAVEDLPEDKKILICNRLSNGGLPGNCPDAIKKDPMKTSQIIVEETKDLKTAAGAKALKAGRIILKFGVVGEGAVIGLDAGIRGYMGRPKNEAFLAATFREGKADDMRKKRAGLTDREFLVDKATNLRNKISSLQQQIIDAERTDNNEMIPSFEKRLKETMAEIEKPFDKTGTRLLDLLDSGSATNISYQRKMENIMDSDRAKSMLAKQTKDDVDMGIPNISDEIEVDAGVSKKSFAPRKTFGSFRNQMLMREPDIRSGINDLYKKGTFGEPGLELTKEKAIKGYKTYLKFYKDQQNAPLSELAEQFGAEQVYGTQGKFASGGLARASFGIGGFTKAQFIIQRMKNSLKQALGKTDADSKYVKETFPNMIKELEAKPELANNENVFKAFSEDLPKNQRIVVHSDDSLDFFTQTKFGPHNIKLSNDFANKHNISIEEASKILKMDPEDRVLETTRLNVLKDKGRTRQASGGLTSLTRTIPPEKGPQSQGLAYFMKNGKR